MIAFHGDVKTKERYLDRVASHRKADELIQGTGWENGRGCAVGCTLEHYDHKSYESELGIPEHIAYLEDAIFEGLPKAEAMLWPERFLRAIKPGADLSLVHPRFIVWMLIDPVDGVVKYSQKHGDKEGEAAIRGVAELYEKRIKGEKISAAARDAASAAARDAASAAASAAGWAAANAAGWAAGWAAASAAARDAARAAASAAASAAGWAAGWAAARDAGWDAARAAARDAGWAAASAAGWAAGWAAASAAARDAGWDAARDAGWDAARAAASAAAYRKQADKLIELLESAPMPVVAA